ncbi:MAG: hypothetical protein ABSG81_05645 [Acidimicrobiales bacterium]|jgi:hypothetical protein
MPLFSSRPVRAVQGLAALGVLGVLATACSSTPAAAPSTSSTAATTAPTAATSTSAAPAVTTTTTSPPVPTTAAPAIPTGLQSSAANAAGALVSAWAADNTARALSVATSQSVTTLFANKYPGGLAISRGCSSSFQPIVCTYGPPGGGDSNDPIYQIYSSEVSGGWYVSSVQIES